MTDRKVSPAVRRFVESLGLHVGTVCQPQHLFRRDVERRFSRVAVPADPWQAYISTEQYLGEWTYGIGATPDEAVLACIPRDLRSTLARCELAVDRLISELDNLHGCLVEVTSRGR